MSNCTGCFHSFGDTPNPHARECEFCIRNPKYPTKKMPKKAIVQDIEIDVPQDFYITHDRKKLEERLLLKKIGELIREVSERKKEKKIIPSPPSLPYEPIPYIPNDDYPWIRYYSHEKAKKKKSYYFD